MVTLLIELSNQLMQRVYDLEVSELCIAVQEFKSVLFSSFKEPLDDMAEN